jgi:predicted PurR-regulated permease PerM
MISSTPAAVKLAVEEKHMQRIFSRRSSQRPYASTQTALVFSVSIGIFFPTGCYSCPQKTTMYREIRPLLLLLLVSSLAFFYVVWPLYGAIMWGVIIALTFTPLHRKVLTRTGLSPSPAAFVTIVVVLLVFILPLLTVLVMIAREAAYFYELVQSGELKSKFHFQDTFNQLPDWCRSLLDWFGLTNFGALQRRVLLLFAQASKFASTQLFGFGQDALDFVINFFVTLYLAFFLIRDGAAMRQTLVNAIPLPTPHREALLDQFTAAVRATVKGNLVVAVVQGTLGGLAFFILGISGAALLAVLMAVLSLLPAFGASLVWLPVAVYLLATGELVPAFALIAYGTLVIGLIDNFLRPILVGRDTKMPDYLVMVSTLGGMAIFGINGFVLGPVIAAMFMAVWRIYLTVTTARTA